MPLVDLVDETYVVAEPAVLATRFADPALWRAWWPELRLTVAQDRGAQGLHWRVAGALTGTSEVWLEPYGDGVIVHYYLRVDPTRPGSDTEPLRRPPARMRRLGRRLARRHTIEWKRRVNALKDELEGSRPVGLPRAARPGPHDPADRRADGAVDGDGSVDGSAARTASGVSRAP